MKSLPAKDSRANNLPLQHQIIGSTTPVLEATVTFDITTVPGIRNALFGGDGLFLAALTGPGGVWLQSPPLSNLAHTLAPYVPSGKGSESAGNLAGAGLAGAVLGGLFGGANRDSDESPLTLNT